LKLHIYCNRALQRKGANKARSGTPPALDGIARIRGRDPTEAERDVVSAGFFDNNSWEIPDILWSLKSLDTAP
jgi:hypothetical protein